MTSLKLGDCLELMKDIHTGSVDMVLCDLPYGTTQNKWDSVINLQELWDSYTRIIKEHGAIVLFSQQPFSSKLICSNPKMFRYEWIWEKDFGTGFLNARKMPLKKHESILVFYKKLPCYNAQGLIYRPHIKNRGKNPCTNYGVFSNENFAEYENYPVDIIKFNHDSSKYHPTQKPVALLEYLIKTYTNEGETVLDNTMGSGSTGVVCVNTERDFIGIDKDETYFDIAQKRIAEAEKERELSLIKNAV